MTVSFTSRKAVPRGIQRASARIVLLAAAAGCSSGITEIPVTGIGVEPIDSAIVQLMRRWDVPGAAAAIAVDGRLVFARGYGYATLDRSEGVRPDHLFRVASVSKPITATAVLRLVDQGRLDLGSDVFLLLDHLLPEGGPADLRIFNATVSHHLHHTAGWTLSSYPDDPLYRMKEIAAATGVSAPPDAESIVRWAATQPLGFSPGIDFTYTNLAYVILARVVEDASGQDYETYVRQNVFAPAGVTRARIGGIRRRDRLDGEVEYASDRSEIWESIFEGESGLADEPAYGGINLPGLDGSSGWVLSMVDLARLGVAVDGNPTPPDILSAAMRTELKRNGSPSGRQAYGAGWFIVPAAAAEAAGFEAVDWVEHGGGMPGTTAYIAVREDGIVIAAALNVNTPELFDDFIRTLILAVERVDAWPAEDLFGLFP